MKTYVPKYKIFYVSDMIYNIVKSPVVVLGQWLLTIHERRKSYIPN